QDHPGAEELCDVEAALVTEPDIDEHDVRPELLLELQCFGARGRHPDDDHAFSLEQHARGVEEGSVVVDYEAANLQPGQRSTRSGSLVAAVAAATAALRIRRGRDLGSGRGDGKPGAAERLDTLP